MALTDMTTCTGTIDSITEHVRASKFDAAFIRIADLMKQLSHLRGQPELYGDSINFTVHMGQLHTMRRLIAKRIGNPNVEVLSHLLVTPLDDMANEINVWVGGQRMRLPAEEEKK